MNEDTSRILREINENDIKFIKLQFVDLFGELKNISITSGQIGKALRGSCTVDAFHLRGMYDLGFERIALLPDPATFAVLPWRPQHGKVARLLCDITDPVGGEIIRGPRQILKAALQKAEEKGYSFDINPDCEFFLFSKDENGHVTTHTGEKAGYLDVAPLDKGENARRELILSLEEMGFEIESSRHELAPGQHSVMFKQMDGIRLADQILTFRTTIRTVAEHHGLHATFMPKPRTDLPGSGMKLTISVFRNGKNLFRESEEKALSFIAGMLEHEAGITAFSNPLVNSYKRLGCAGFAPSESYWSRRDRFASIRLVRDADGSPCIEWTLPDGAADPYLILAAVAAAGTDGIERNLAAPPEGEGRRALPATLLASLHELTADDFLRQICGEAFVGAYVKEKEAEWFRYSREVTDWELNEYLRRV